MEIFKNQSLEYKDVLVCRKRVKQSELPRMVNFIDRNIDALDLKIVGGIITVGFGGYTDFIIPVNREYKTTPYFSYLSPFVITGAVKVRHKGEVSHIKESRSLLERYIKENNLSPVTGFYYYFAPDSAIEVYIGVRNCQAIS